MSGLGCALVRREGGYSFADAVALCSGEEGFGHVGGYSWSLVWDWVGDSWGNKAIYEMVLKCLVMREGGRSVSLTRN